MELKVTVDGQEGAALGVMSQGELHSLALSLFIPRATLPESPFRFVVIDDPVQSMDPARVDGLPRVLEAASQDRQVVLFTHDDRLHESVRRLGIAAIAIEITRREGSVVEPRRSKDPVSRYIEDAMALAHTDDFPAQGTHYVPAGSIRQSKLTKSITDGHPEVLVVQRPQVVQWVRVGPRCLALHHPRGGRSRQGLPAPGRKRAVAAARQP